MRAVRKLSLRARLVVSCVALIAVVAAVIGVVTSVALHSYLEHQVDVQLGAAVKREHGRGLQFVAAPGQPLGTVGLRDGSGARSVGAAGTRPEAHLASLNEAQAKALAGVAKDGKPHTVSVPGLGEYRAVVGGGERIGGPGPGPGPGLRYGEMEDGDGSGSGVGVGAGSADEGQEGAGRGSGSAAQADGGETSKVVLGFPLEGAQETVRTLVVVVVCVTLAALVAVGLAGNALVGAALRPLRRIAATATRVSELPLDRGEVALHERVPQAQADPRTEVGQVGAALNRMLGHVGSALAARQESEVRVRRFVADASHELRTPLASIRGYAELTRRGREAGAAGPDTRHALGRIESEATRMTGLVEDLLLLARLDAGVEGGVGAGGPGAGSVGSGAGSAGSGSGSGSAAAAEAAAVVGSGSGAGVGALAAGGGAPLYWESTDLVPMVVDAVSDARAAGQGHVWRLELPDEPVVVRGDPARLQQVLVNLLGNARTHTPPGTRVTARVRETPATREGWEGPEAPTGAEMARGWALVEVRDDGPGVAPELVGRVFERFARGDVSRARAAVGTRSPARPAGAAAAVVPASPLAPPSPASPASTGLGLAIVRAVAEAHGGKVGVESVPGSTVFSVWLPLA